MFFCEQLNKYIKQIECSSKELVNASGLSIYIDLHHALKIVAKRFLKHFPTIIWRMFYFFVLLNPRNASAHFG